MYILLFFCILYITSTVFQCSFFIFLNDAEDYFNRKNLFTIIICQKIKRRYKQTTAY